jgi:hypothetical protein
MVLKFAVTDSGLVIVTVVDAAYPSATLPSHRAKP